jgi:hypothetical protein
MERVQMLQKRAKRYDSALQGAYHASGSRDEVTENLTKSIARSEKLKSVFAKLRDDNPKYELFFDQLLVFCNE